MPFPIPNSLYHIPWSEGDKWIQVTLYNCGEGYALASILEPEFVL